MMKPGETAREFLDDLAADDPLYALRHYPRLLSRYRLEACMIAEPEAALIHAYELLTEAQRRACSKAARRNDLKRFIPDRLEAERRIAYRRERGEDETDEEEEL